MRWLAHRGGALDFAAAQARADALCASADKPASGATRA